MDRTRKGENSYSLRQEGRKQFIGHFEAIQVWDIYQTKVTEHEHPNSSQKKGVRNGKISRREGDGRRARPELKMHKKAQIGRKFPTCTRRRGDAI